MKLYNDSQNVYHPHFADEQKSRIKAIVRFTDGRLSEMEVSLKDENSPLLRDIFAQHTRDEIEANTARESALRENRESLDRVRQEDRAREEERDKLFQAKSQALSVVEVAGEAGLVARIRKAKTVAEVYGLVAVAMIKSDSAK